MNKIRTNEAHISVSGPTSEKGEPLPNFGCDVILGPVADAQKSLDMARTVKSKSFMPL
jgi:hypothetical protein